MPLPSLDKTWQFNVNNVYRTTATALTDNQNLLYALKNILKGFALTPWTVRYSCDGTTAGVAGDGVDRWSAANKLIWSATNRSWIVLRQTGVLSGGIFEMCLDLDSATVGRISVIFAANGNAFTGGAVNARPTAVGEIAERTNANSAWHGFGDTATFDCILYVWQSTDGACSRWYIIDATGASKGFGFMDAVKNPVAGWTYPAVFTWLSALATSYSTLNDNAYFHSYFPPVMQPTNLKMSLYLTSEFYIAATLGENRASYSDVSGEWLLSSPGLACAEAGRRGRHGELYDWWWGTALRQNGDTYPDDNTRQFIALGTGGVFPWNGTIPVVTL